MTILEILDASTIDWKETPNENEIRACCPFCVENNETPDSRYRLGINIGDGRAHCFNCGWRSDSYVLTARELARIGEVDMIGLSVTAQKPEAEPVKRKAPVAQVLTDMPDGYERFNWKSEFERDARNYLLSRGITRDQIDRWEIGWAIVGKYAGRIIIPVRMDDDLAGVVCRDYTGRSTLRYMNSESLRGVFGAKGHKTAVMSEGAMDALRIEPMVKGEDSIALFGSNISDDQMRFLQRYDTITYMGDQDAPGCKGARYNCAMMSDAGIKIRVCIPAKLDGADPGTQSDEEIVRRRRAAVVWSTDAERLLKFREAFR